MLGLATLCVAMSFITNIKNGLQAICRYVCDLFRHKMLHTLPDHSFELNCPDVTQSGRWSSFGKRVWFTESHIYVISLLLVVLLTQFILDN
jgi:hypothetical protein